jgi:hypothetical protein
MISLTKYDTYQNTYESKLALLCDKLNINLRIIMMVKDQRKQDFGS